jgi:hypothetical protein
MSMPFAFAGCRASFYLTHAKVAANTKPDAAHSSHATAPPPPPAAAAAAGPLRGVYAPYLHECIERDGSKTVGLGLSMWILMLAFVLLSGTPQKFRFSTNLMNELTPTLGCAQ